MPRVVRSRISAPAALIALALLVPASAAAQGNDAEAGAGGTETTNIEALALIIADVYGSATMFTDLAPRSVFTEATPEGGVVTNLMDVAQRRYAGGGAEFLRAMDDLRGTDGVTIHAAGAEDFFSTSTTTNVVLVGVPKGTLECGPGAYAELAVFEFYPSEFVVVANPNSVNDPGVGSSSAYSIICQDGVITTFYGIVNDQGVLVQYAVPVAIVEIQLGDRTVYAFATPRNVPLRVAQSGAPVMERERVAVVTAEISADDAPAGSPVPTSRDDLEEGALAFLIGLLEVLGGPDGVPLNASPASSTSSTSSTSSLPPSGSEAPPTNVGSPAASDVEDEQEAGKGSDDTPLILYFGALVLLFVFIAAIPMYQCFRKRRRPIRLSAPGWKVSTGAVRKRSAMGGMTDSSVEFDTPDPNAPERGTTIDTSGADWIPLEGGEARRSVFRRVAEVAETSGIEPNENENFLS